MDLYIVHGISINGSPVAIITEAYSEDEARFRASQEMSDCNFTSAYPEWERSVPA